MKAKALDRYLVPRYPTYQEILYDPKRIERTMPAAVRHLLETGISGAMALLVPLSGCDRNPAGPAQAPSSQQVEGQDSSAPQTSTVIKADLKVFLVAPIFSHGEGRGSMGCVVVSPPVFLSEEEGLAIIKEELAKTGVVLKNQGNASKKIQIRHEFRLDNKKADSSDADLTGKQDPIVVEFISFYNYQYFGGQGSSSTAQRFDFKELAEQTRSSLQKVEDQGVFGIFYDPLVRLDYTKAKMPQWRENLFDLQYKISSSAGKKTVDSQRNKYMDNLWKQYEKETQEEAKELLRQQVQDFAQWLVDNTVM
jgi:hypothetical protein